MISRTVDRLFWKLIQHVFSLHCGDISFICVFSPDKMTWIISILRWKWEVLLFYRIHNSYLWPQSFGMIFTSSQLFKYVRCVFKPREHMLSYVHSWASLMRYNLITCKCSTIHVKLLICLSLCLCINLWIYHVQITYHTTRFLWWWNIFFFASVFNMFELSKCAAVI